MPEPGPEYFDAIVIGTGFAGAVTAARLTQAGLRICILERGRRYAASDLPIYPQADPDADSGGPFEAGGVQPDISRCFWKFGRGLWDVRNLEDVMIAQAAAYGGGSLVYANVHLRAPPEVFEEGWPREYRRAELDAYYDLAAHMLDVKPVPASVAHSLAKTAQLERAAKALDREGQYFLPPLAVNFEPLENGNNRFGREQGACDLRGDCCFGCPRQAKNTLDLNYLAIAEDETEPAKDGASRPLADVRTLAEVVSIEHLRDDASARYEVTYLDHLAGATPSEAPVRAKYVFLCAGAVNSTELLMRCRAADKLECASEKLGAGYYPNADEFAAVFGCDDVHEPDRGPTITSALLYHGDADEAGRRDWFLVEEGGAPSALEPLLGAFRSPLWARRNRYLENPDPSTRERPADFAPLPFDTVIDILSGTTRSAVRPRLPLAHEIGERFLAVAQAPPGTGAAPGAGEQWRLLPDQLRAALEADREELLDFVARAAEPFATEFLDKAAKRIEERYDLEEILKESRFLGSLDVEGIRDQNIPRRVLRLGIQLVWGSEGDMIREMAEVLLARLAPEPKGLVGRFSDLLKWALDYRLGDGHTAVLLGMGRDAAPGTLALGASSDGPAPPRVDAALRVSLPGPLETPERGTQERLFRDIAKVWRGELRTGPLWHAVRRRVSVHSQGGCPMGESEETSVTRANGEVFGCPGLYVMDAAAFPRPVGVNPSATIAAVAEYKVERVLQGILGEDRDIAGREKAGAWAGTRARQKREASAWAGQGERRGYLELPGAGAVSSRPPDSQPVGIRFAEAMEGRHDAIPGELRARFARRRGRIGPQMLERILGFRSDEPRGSGSSEAIRTDLGVEIPDLAAFLADDEAGRKPRMRACGSVEIEGVADLPNGPLAISRHESYIEFGRGAGGGLERSLDYELHLLEHPYHVVGRKIIRDDDRLDLWEDTTTLYFALCRDGDDVPVRRGVLRLPAHDFFARQLPGMIATNTDDPARQSWALAAFARYFFDHLVDVYVPELDQVVDVVKQVTERTHA